jgi:ketosteroid isomerase-like protein
MKTSLLGALVGLAISFALPTFAQQKETVDPQLIQKLDDTINNKYNKAINNHDAAALGALYTEDAIFVTVTGPVYGRKAIEK